MMEVREATLADEVQLLRFFKLIYRKSHPLHNMEFWNWQYGNPEFGRSFICLNQNGEIVGHVGANFGGGLAWIINVYLNEECRGQGVLGKLYSLARAYYPLAATAANAAGLGLYKNMRWIRYYDLVRYVKINPEITDTSVANVTQKVEISHNGHFLKQPHYFKQPGITGIEIADSTAASQENVGGLRIVSLGDLKILEEKAWQYGYSWMDYITSWNDLKTKDLEKNGWILDYKSTVPWHLNPVQEGYFCDITFLSEEPLDKEFIVQRSYSDHGRTGSL